MFRKTVRDFVEQEINPHVDEWEAAGIVPGPRAVPEDGRRSGCSASSTTRSTAARAPTTATPSSSARRWAGSRAGGVAMAICVQTDMATPSLHRFGSRRAEGAVPRAGRSPGEMVAAIAVTEPDAGSDVAGIRTRAVRDGDEWVINGTKLYITNGTQADWLCLLARTSDEGGSPGHEPDRGADRHRRVLGEPQARQARHALVGHRRADLRRRAGAGREHHRRDRPGLPAADGAVPERAADRRLHGRGRACELALERTIAYLRERQAFGRPLADNQ